MAHWKLIAEARTLFRVYNKQHAVGLAKDSAKNLGKHVIIEYVIDEHEQPLPVAYVCPNGHVEELYCEE